MFRKRQPARDGEKWPVFELKKVLSLALVLAMVLTLVPAAFAVDKYEDYTDKDQITQVEAVQVLTGMGIINGMDTGAFKPTGSLTRAEAAKITAYVKLGKDTAEALPAATSFSDVPSTNWAAKYVAYCAKEGIIAGYEDKTFRPNNTLTADQFIKMLLVAVGYDPKVEGLEGNGWDSNTRLLAISSKMLKAADLKLPFNRETACYYALQALLMPGSSYKYYVQNGAGQTVEKTKRIGDLGYTIFGLLKNQEVQDGKIVDSTTGLNDEFMRPANVYTYDCGNKKTVFVKAPVAEFNNKELKPDGSEITKVMSKDPTIDNVYVDGKADTNTTAADVAKNLSGNGVVLEVYETAKDHYTIVVVNTYVDKLAKADIQTPKDDDAYIKLANPADTDGDDLTFVTSDFAKDDVVAYTVADGKVMTATKLTGTNGTITATNATPYYVRVDGEQKSVAKIKFVADNKSLEVGGKGVFYYDEYGNIKYVDQFVAPKRTYDGYMMLISYQAQPEGTPSGDLINAKPADQAAAKAKVLDLTTGVVSVVDRAIVKEDDGWYYADKDGVKAGKLSDTEGAVSGNNAFFGYYKMDDGSYVFGSAGGDTNTAYRGTVTTGKGKADVATGLVATDSTVMTVVNYDNKKEASVVSTYTGYKNFPEFTSQKAVVVTEDKPGSTKITAIFVVGEVEAPKTINYAIYLRDGEVADKSFKYTFLIDGEEQEITSTKAITTTLEPEKVYDLSVNEKGEYGVGDAPLTANATGSVQIIGSAIMVNGAQIEVNDDTMIYVKHNVAEEGVEYGEGVSADVYYEAVPQQGNVAKVIVVTAGPTQ